METININNFDEKLYYEKLDNGLQVFVVPIKNKKSFVSMLVTKYGGRDINFKIDDVSYKTPTGIAHFLEHKMFEQDDEPFKFYHKYGCDVNAFTSDDSTCYYFSGSKGFEKGLRYLLNWIQKFGVTLESVKKEQGIILEEASMYEDIPNRKIYDKIQENLYVVDPKKNEVIGTKTDIVSITPDDLNLCYNSFYVPNNMYLIVTGNVNPKKVIDIAKSETLSFKPSLSKIERIYGDEPDEVSSLLSCLNMNVEVPKVAAAYKINKNIFSSIDVTSFELDVYLHTLISIALGTTSLTRLEWLSEKLFSDAFYRISEIDTHYVLEFYADSERVDDLVFNLKKFLPSFSVDRESFEREKKLWIANEIRQIDNPMSTLYGVLDDLLDYGEFISNKIDIVKNLDYDILIKIKDILYYNCETIVKVLPKE